MPHFLIHSLAAAGVADIDDSDLDEEHWRYTDPHTATMIARGPTLDRERREWTGSIHILDLPDLDTVHRYIDNEPYHRAGGYRAHRVWRFEDLLGRTMWDTDRVAEKTCYFLVSTEGRADVAPRTPVNQPLAELIVLGRLRDPITDASRGLALAVQVPSRSDLDTVLDRTLGPPAVRGRLDAIDWEFGGRR